MNIIGVLKFITAHPLNRGHLFRTLIRFAQWQIKSRWAAGFVVHNWVGQSKFYVRNGETGLTGNIYTGLHEFADMGFLLHVLREEDLFIDVGSNVGSYTILATAVAGTRSYAFEPVPSTFSRLLENLRLNGIDGKVIARNVGVGREETTISFTTQRDTSNHVVAAGEDATGAVSVPVVMLDKELCDKNPFLMKIDVEGFETPVLEGAVSVLSNPSLQAVIMELNGSADRYGYDESAIAVTMSNYGFKPYTYDPLTRKLILLRSLSTESGNVIFVRDEALVASRLSTAPSIDIHGRRF